MRTALVLFVSVLTLFSGALLSGAPAYAWQCPPGVPDNYQNEKNGKCKEHTPVPTYPPTSTPVPPTNTPVPNTPVPPTGTPVSTPTSIPPTLVPTMPPVTTSGGGSSNNIRVCVWEASPSGGMYNLVSKPADTPGIALLPHSPSPQQDYLPDTGTVCVEATPEIPTVTPTTVPTVQATVVPVLSITVEEVVPTPEATPAITPETMTDMPSEETPPEETVEVTPPDTGDGTLFDPTNVDNSQ